jgi:hypothetical protein
MIGDVMMLVTDVNGGAMVVSGFVIADVPMLMISEVRSSCYHLD